LLRRQNAPLANLSSASLIFPTDTSLGQKYRRIQVSDSISAPLPIARIGDGNIISIGDGADSQESYCFIYEIIFSNPQWT
jgi:hypothetical protein